MSPYLRHKNKWSRFLKVESTIELKAIKILLPLLFFSQIYILHAPLNLTNSFQQTITFIHLIWTYTNSPLSYQ